jgi:predicted restriction endonuclease
MHLTILSLEAEFSPTRMFCRALSPGKRSKKRMALRPCARCVRVSFDTVGAKSILEWTSKWDVEYSRNRFSLVQNDGSTFHRSWSRNIVTFKTYSTDEDDGKYLWDSVQDRMSMSSPLTGFHDDHARYGEPILVRPRLGQGTFRILVTDKYERRCAVTGERTLPALDAAHIRPYVDGGTHDVSNGLLLRRDIHSLFDSGYVTVTPDYRFEVSQRIRQEFENGRAYYALNGSPVAVPDCIDLRPDRAALTWHNTERFKA